MAEKIFVVPRGDSWAVRREGEATDMSTHFSRNEAIEMGRSLSSSGQCELVIHEDERRSRPREASQPAVVSRS
jgi:hypothetical protein